MAKTCDICKHVLMKPGKVPAVYDGKTVRGPWAFMCESCFKKYGVGLPGQGKKLSDG